MAPRAGHIFKPVADRLEEKFIPEPNSGCWLWFGATNGEDGYGKLSIGRTRRVYAHRASYELARGPIPDGMQLDHRCRNPSCVNPDHLEPATNAENTRRGKVSALRPARLTCKREHDLSAHGYIDTQGKNQCRECLHIRQRAYHARRNAR